MTSIYIVYLHLFLCLHIFYIFIYIFINVNYWPEDLKEQRALELYLSMKTAHESTRKHYSFCYFNSKFV